MRTSKDLWILFPKEKKYGVSWITKEPWFLSFFLSYKLSMFALQCIARTELCIQLYTKFLFFLVLILLCFPLKFSFKVVSPARKNMMKSNLEQSTATRSGFQLGGKWCGIINIPQLNCWIDSRKKQHSFNLDIDCPQEKYSGSSRMGSWILFIL